MRKTLTSLVLFALCLLFLSSRDYGQGRPGSPGLREGERRINAPIDPPMTFKQKTADATKLQQEADELAKLSAGIRMQIDLVNHGQMPKDLPDQLKHIEKMAKHLRSEIMP